MRLAIVDDEKLVRYHIRCLVAEADPSIEIIEAENGTEFVELAAAGRIDGAFVDIRMPKMDGLQALHELAKRGTYVPWAVLSSHSEFEYAKRALELGALGYALKPPSSEEVAGLVAKLRGAYSRVLAEKTAAFEREWRSLAHGTTSIAPLSSDRLFSAALLAADGPGPEAKVRLAAIGRAVAARGARHAEEGFRIAVLPRQEPAMIEIALCAEAAGDSAVPEAMRRLWNECAAAATNPGSLGSDLPEEGANAFRIALLFTGGERDAAAARNGLADVRRAIDCRALLAPGTIEAGLARGQLAAFGTADLEAASSLGRAASAVAGRDGRALREAAAAYAAAARYGIGSRATELLGRFADRVLPGAAEALADATGVALLEAGERAIRLAEGDACTADGDTIAAVEDFIRHRYAERLSLAETARIFGLTPNYLSTLFHRRVGMTFVEYATELRLTRARELLRSGKSVKEAAWAVGYGSERHFARLYRRRFGSPPVEEKRTKNTPSA